MQLTIPISNETLPILELHRNDNPVTVDGESRNVTIYRDSLDFEQVRSEKKVVRFLLYNDSVS